LATAEKKRKEKRTRRRRSKSSSISVSLSWRLPAQARRATLSTGRAARRQPPRPCHAGPGSAAAAARRRGRVVGTCWLARGSTASRSRVCAGCGLPRIARAPPRFARLRAVPRMAGR
jgi:hypothetical protein